MDVMDRRTFLRLFGTASAGGTFLSVFPSVLYRPSWVESAAAQTPPTVSAAFVALVETVNDTGEDDATVPVVAAWLVAEFDKALPPLPSGSPSAAVAAILDAYAVQGGHGITFASSPPEGRRVVLEALVKDGDPAMRQLANQLLPFAGYAYWSDVALEEPAVPGGSRRRSRHRRDDPALPRQLTAGLPPGRGAW